MESDNGENYKKVVKQEGKKEENDEEILEKTKDLFKSLDVKDLSIFEEFIGGANDKIDFIPLLENPQTYVNFLYRAGKTIKSLKTFSDSSTGKKLDFEGVPISIGSEENEMEAKEKTLKTLESDLFQKDKTSAVEKKVVKHQFLNLKKLKKKKISQFINNASIFLFLSRNEELRYMLANILIQGLDNFVFSHVKDQVFISSKIPRSKIIPALAALMNYGLHLKEGTFLSEGGRQKLYERLCNLFSEEKYIFEALKILFLEK